MDDSLQDVGLGQRSPASRETLRGARGTKSNCVTNPGAFQNVLGFGAYAFVFWGLWRLCFCFWGPFVLGILGLIAFWGFFEACF